MKPTISGKKYILKLWGDKYSSKEIDIDTTDKDKAVDYANMFMAENSDITKVEIYAEKIEITRTKKPVKIVRLPQ